MIDREQLAADGEDDDARLEDDEIADGGADEQATDEGEDEGRAELEAKARELGWKPKTDWKGDRSGWVDADEFVTRHKPAKLREAQDRQARELAELKREREVERREYEDRITRLDRMTRKALERQRAQIINQTKAAQRAAAEAGDMEAFDAWQSHEQKVAADLAKEEEELAPAPQRREAQQPDPTVAAWVKENPAIAFDPVKWNAAVAFFEEATRDLPDGTIADHLAHVEDRIRQTWPNAVKGAKRAQNGNGRANGHDEGGEQRTQRAPQTERSGRIGVRPARGKGWTDIPAEERKIYKGYINEGLFKDEAEAAKAHWS